MPHPADTEQMHHNSLGPAPLNTLFDVDEDGHTVKINPITALPTLENSVRTRKEGDNDLSVDRFSMIMSMYNDKSHKSQKHGNLNSVTIDHQTQNQLQIQICG